MSVLQAPNILVIQLKVSVSCFWFQMVSVSLENINVWSTKLVLQRFEGIFGGKIDKAIAFGEILVLSSFMSKASKVQDSDTFF